MRIDAVVDRAVVGDDGRTGDVVKAVVGQQVVVDRVLHEPLDDRQVAQTAGFFTTTPR
jgi:hypothetical protein